MAKCIKKYRKITRVCIGSLNRKIIVNTRSIRAPTGASVDFTEDFTEPKTVWAMIDTIDGTTIFDDTNTEQVVTHDIYIRYFSGVTPEKWVKLLSINGGSDVYLDILKAENYQEGNNFYRLRCNLRGKDTLLVNES